MAPGLVGIKECLHGGTWQGLLWWLWGLRYTSGALLSILKKSYREAVRIGFTPPHLVVTGPYRYSRNPMYVAGLFAWIGWTIFYGNLAVFAGLVFLWSVFTLRIIPYEENQLEALFGSDYIDYKKSVPRWLGRI